MRLLITILLACFSSVLAHGYSNMYPNTSSTTDNAWGASWKQFNLSETSSCDYTNTGQYIGQYSANRYAPDSTSNTFSQYGSKFSSDSINNDFGSYGSQFSQHSARNPYATDAPKLYDGDCNYRGKLSTNRFEPDSIANPFGRYGSRYSPDSINNPYGAGSRYAPDSPNNPFGSGWSIYGQ